jgi:hypothetical protein
MSKGYSNETFQSVLDRALLDFINHRNEETYVLRDAARESIKLCENEGKICAVQMHFC